MAVLCQIFGDTFLKGRMCPASPQSITRLRHVDPGPGQIRTLIHIDHAANRTAVDTHAQFQLGMCDVRPRNLQRHSTGVSGFV